MKRYFPLLLLVVGGCQSAGGLPIIGDSDLVYEVEKEFSPLEYIRQRPDVVSDLGYSESSIATIGESAYVADLEDWLERHPPGSAIYRAKMLHEQLHAKRQKNHGVFSWISRYLYNSGFMLYEELLGYYVELRELKRLGHPININGYALTMAKYKNLSGKPMISFEDARRWIINVLNGSWEPPE